MDYIAILSGGAYPTPGATSTQRASLGVSYGFLDSLVAGSSAPTTIAGIYPKFFGGYWCCDREPRDR